MISSRLAPFGTTIFAEMTRLAQEHGAINLAQGFPDFEGPPAMIDAAIAALKSGQNQYARPMGHLDLVRAIATKQERDYGLGWDPLSEVLVFSGATEGIAATLLGLIEPGDEVITFEPFYDSYPAVLSLVGATMRPCTLRFPDFALDADALARCFTPRTKAILLNTPHNPTGKVFTRAELEVIARLCIEHDVVAITDEVYEHLVWGDAKHVPLATLPGMRDRTITLSSAGKTFSYTGWKIGWATGPKNLIGAANAAHQFLTFSTATPLQVAVANALVHEGPAFYADLKREYEERRGFLLETLVAAGFKPAAAEGTYFVLADFSALSSLDDRAFARDLTARVGVAAIPPSPFYREHPEEGRKLLRFAFCKRMETLQAAAERLRRMG